MNEIALTLLDYPISWLELIATLAGLISVWLAVRNNVLTWPVGLLNSVGFGLLFYQFRLYSDTLLQIYFFGMGIYGWVNWRKSDEQDDGRILTFSPNDRIRWLLYISGGTILLGTLMTRADVWLPYLFPEPAAFPFADAFTTVTSIAAVVLLARRYLESWLLWMIVDVVSIVLYFTKGILLVGVEYVIFLLLASWGGIRWWQVLKSQEA